MWFHPPTFPLTEKWGDPWVAEGKRTCSIHWPCILVKEFYVLGESNYVKKKLCYVNSALTCEVTEKKKRIFLPAASWVPEPGSANSPTPGHQGADAESVGCLQYLELRYHRTPIYTKTGHLSILFHKNCSWLCSVGLLFPPSGSEGNYIIIVLTAIGFSAMGSVILVAVASPLQL